MAIFSTCTLLYIGGTLLLLYTLLHFYLKSAYKYWPSRGVVLEPPKSIIKTLHDLIFPPKAVGDQFIELYSKYKAQGLRYFGTQFFGMPFFVAIDPELIKNILAKDFHHFMDRGVHLDEENDPLSANLFSLTGLKWKHLRQKLTPTFTSGKLKRMFQTLVDCTVELQDCLDTSISKDEPIDIKKVLVQYTTDVIGSCAFGLDCNSFKNPDSEFMRVTAKAFKFNFIDRCKFFFIILCPWVLKALKIPFTKKEVDYFFRKLTKETIEYREKNNVTRNDFMQLLMQLKNNGIIEDDEVFEKDKKDKNETIGTTLTLNEVAAQAFSFFFAGYETSSTTMTFCLYELAENMDIQEKVRKEIVNVLKKHDGKVTYAAVMEMNLLERCIQEALRIHPPLELLQRKVIQDYKIPGTETVLEKGIPIFVPSIAVQMDPEYYPEPAKFNPDHFTEEGKSSRPDYTWLPFGEGPRGCIGLRFGMMQTKVGICRLLLNYRFKPNPKTRTPLEMDRSNAFRSAKGGIWLSAEKITS